MAISPQLQRLQRRIDRIPAAIIEEIGPTLAKQGDRLAERIADAAPKDTGALADSVAVTLPGQSTPAYSQPGGARVARENEVLVTVGNHAVRYPHLVEYGTADAPAQPYFWATYHALKKSLGAAVRRDMRAIIKRYWAE
jgi:HK97 gp10 family phage protein